MKKKLIQINSVCNGSTGKIMREIQKVAEEHNYDTISFYSRKAYYKDLKCEKICPDYTVYLHGILTLLFNNHGSYSYFYTKKLIKRLRQINPDIIHLHNIHGYYINCKLLFDYLKYEFKGDVYWTLHDCWSFTGHCAYFDYANCSKWKKECFKCPQMKKYPFSLFFDTSKKEYYKKKEIFNGAKNLTIITPSEWLANLVKKSFLNYPVKVINNGIDLSIFKENKSMDVLKKYKINKNLKTIIGVANIWEARKGFDDFIKLSRDLKKNINIVMIGLNKKQIKKLPHNVIGIERTENQEELIKLYSIADIFVNPTLEDNYPTVNLEAVACGTPIITYNTGGCKEQVFPNTGYVCDGYEDLLEKINLCLEKDYKKNVFNNKKHLKKIDGNYKYKEYLDLYEEGMK